MVETQVSDVLRMASQELPLSLSLSLSPYLSVSLAPYRLRQVHVQK